MNNVILSISNQKLNCEKVVNKLFEMKILSSVHENKSVVESKEELKIEKGCNIKFTRPLEKKDFKEKIWNPIKDEFNLKCAHLKVDNEYSGCVNKFE